MLRITLLFGGVAGTGIILTTIMGLALNDGQHGNMLIGYLVMLVALSLIFVGVKRYRDQELGGVITFGKAFLVGLAISAVASLFYVVIWDIYLAATDYAYISDYAAGLLEAKRQAGASEEELAALAAQQEEIVKNYANPLFRIPVTFSEIFPVGLVVSLVSAFLLRNRNFMPART